VNLWLNLGDKKDKDIYESVEVKWFSQRSLSLRGKGCASCLFQFYQPFKMVKFGRALA
jgi:hypothetical protein